jgi:hypothetical protein
MACTTGAATPVSMELGVATAVPEASGGLVVLVHGLARTERCWRGSDDAPGLARSLAAHPTFTLVAVRYDTGLPIAVKASRLGALLEELAGLASPDRFDRPGRSLDGRPRRSDRRGSRRASRAPLFGLTDRHLQVAAPTNALRHKGFNWTFTR